MTEPGLPGAETRVVGAPAAQVVKHRHDARRLLRRMPFQPLAKEPGNLVRQAQQRVAGADGALLVRRAENFLEFVVGDVGNQRGDENRERDAGCGQPANRLQTGQRSVEGGQRNADVGQPVARQFGPQVEVAQDQRRLGDHRHRMAGFQHHLEQAAGQALLALEGLVGVGGAAEDDGRAGVAGAAQRLAQQLLGIRLVEDLRLEIEARRQPEVGMGRPRIAVDATVLAAAIGIDRLAEAEVGRLVAAEDGFRAIDQQRGARVRRHFRRPSVILGLPGVRAEAMGHIAHCTTPP